MLPLLFEQLFSSAVANAEFTNKMWISTIYGVKNFAYSDGNEILLLVRKQKGDDSMMTFETESQIDPSRSEQG